MTLDPAPAPLCQPALPDRCLTRDPYTRALERAIDRAFAAFEAALPFRRATLEAARNR